MLFEQLHCVKCFIVCQRCPYCIHYKLAKRTVSTTTDVTAGKENKKNEDRRVVWLTPFTESDSLIHSVYNSSILVP